MFGLVATAALGVANAWTMRAVRSTDAPGCGAPDFSCVTVEKDVVVPTPSAGQALIHMIASSVNPSDVDIVEMGASGGRTLGNDMSGYVVSCNNCTRLKVGDFVWGGTGQAFADFVVHDETTIGKKPLLLDPISAGTIPEVGLTSLFSLKRTGAPWNKENLTVVVTSGSGGTGFIGIQLAKALGATTVVTSTSSANVDFVKRLGADLVVDYTQDDIFEVLPDNSVDIVYDNYGAEGTADKAMHTIRSGGMYLLMPHGECFFSNSQEPPCLSATPKEGVTQVNYAVSGIPLEGLDELGALFDQFKLKPAVEKVFSLEDIISAYNTSHAGHVVGKIAVSMTGLPVTV